MNPEAADKTVEFWRSAESELNLNSSGTSAQDSQARSAWAKMALAQAHLLTANNFTPQAEELFHTALELAPSNPEVVMDYVNLLVQNGRGSEAIPVLENSMRLAPQDERFGALLDQLHSKGLR
jgi:predicted Zn-dependent protease